jgi:tetratricopeptide (TPR) repeat protein
MDLHQRRASERIHGRLLALAADFTATAAFSAIDRHKLNDAKRHLDEASALAGMSQDPSVQLRVWINIAMLSYHQGKRADAIAAGQAALRVARRDPFYSSLAHARLAVAHADNYERQAALRSLGNASDALDRSGEDPTRPSWISFYGPAELRTLTAITYLLLDQPELAETASHQALAMTPREFRRNRALATARLAMAQLEQGDVDQACTSAHGVVELMAGEPLPGRMRTVLGDFYRLLLTTAPGAPTTVEWTERARAEWSRPS